MKNNSNTVQLKEIDVTFAHILKYAGYDAALFGKYSIGSQMGVTDPLAMGFDTWYGMYSILEGHRQYPHILWRDGKKIRIEENEGGRQGAYAQELFTREMIVYIEQEHDNPFFVFLAFSSPHAELAAPEKYTRLYENQFKEYPYTGMSTGSPCDKYAWYYPTPVENPRATFAGMVTALDDYVGQIVAALEKKGILDNTLIIFTSDNGPHDEGGGDPTFFKASTPYKGMKRDVYDGGIHVPMIVHWPKEIRNPRVDDTPGHSPMCCPRLPISRGFHSTQCHECGPMAFRFDRCWATIRELCPIAFCIGNSANRREIRIQASSARCSRRPDKANGRQSVIA